MKTKFEKSEELCTFVEQFAQKAMPKPEVKDVVIDIQTGDVFMKWEDHHFLISLNLKVEEEITPGVDLTCRTKTPMAKIIEAYLLMYYNIRAKREKKRNNK